MTFPVPQPYKITQGYSSNHLGIDIAPIPAGQPDKPFLAPQSGTIVRSGYDTIGGWYLMLQAGPQTFYYAGHFKAKGPNVGAEVLEGQQIAILGKSGPTSGPNSVTGVHTHFECRTTITGGQINPMSINWSKEGDTIVADIKIVGTPASVSNDTGRIDVVARGSDDGLWHKWYDGGKWSGWEKWGGGIASAPSISSWGKGRYDIFAQGVAGDLMHFWYDGKISNPESLGVIK